MAFATASLAQVPDTLEVAPEPVVVDTLDVGPDVPVAPRDTVVAARDTVEAPPPLPVRPVVQPPGPPRVGGVTPVPARAPEFNTAAILDPLPGVWRYELGVPGAPDGVAFGALPPQRLGLRLDGRPADDLFTGRAALERLPSDMLAPLHAGTGPYGTPTGVDAYLRAYAAEVPITELRYRAGPDDHQFLGVTHSQVRRPGFIGRLGGEHARLGVLAHVSGDRAGGEYVNANLTGYQLIGRVTATLPGIALELTERHLRRNEGAWGGVDPAAPNPFVRTAPPRFSFGERETIHNDLSIRARAEIFGGVDPMLVQLYWTAATHRFVSVDSMQSRGHRYGLVVEQSVAWGAHRLAVEADLRAGRIVGGNAFVNHDGVIPPEAHVAVRDSVRLGEIDLVLRLGAHAGRDSSYPSAHLEAGRTAGAASVRLAVFAGGARFSPVERLGFGDLLHAGPISTERLAGARGEGRVLLGPVSVTASAEMIRRFRPRLLLLDDALAGEFLTLDGHATAFVGAVGLAIREDASRGLYGHAWAATHRTLEDGPTDIHRREAAAMPEYYAFGRLGVRGRGLFGGNLDIDLFARGRAWTAHRGRALHPATGLLGLAPPAAPAIPARGVLDAVLQAGLGRGRATVFVAYENALSGAAYPGVFVVPVYPFAEPRLRIGVFWVLAG